MRTHVARAMSQPRPEQTPPRSPAPRRQLLIIEDDPDIRDVLELILRHPLVSIETACDAAAGLEQARRMEPHVIMLDLTLPDSTARDVFGELSRAPFDPRIIFMSGLPASDLAAKARELGAYAYFHKPFEPGVRARVFEALGIDGEVTAGAGSRPP